MFFSNIAPAHAPKYTPKTNLFSPQISEKLAEEKRRVAELEAVVADSAGREEESIGVTFGAHNSNRQHNQSATVRTDFDTVHRSSF